MVRYLFCILVYHSNENIWNNKKNLVSPVAGTNSAGGGAFAFKFDALLTGIGTPGKLLCAFCCCASDDVTVVLDTWRDPELLLPLEPESNTKKKKKQIVVEFKWCTYQ